MVISMYIKFKQGLLAVVIFLLLAGVARAELAVEIDRQQINTGERFTLIINLGDAVIANPDLSGLDKDFRLVGRSQASRINMINGQFSRQNKLTLTLEPKKLGKLVIPAIKVNGDSTRPISVEVLAGANISSQSQIRHQQKPAVDLKDSIRILESFPTSTSYVQQPIVYTLKILMRKPVYNADLNKPEILEGNALVEPYGDGLRYQKKINGKLVDIFEQRYLIVPQRSGRLSLRGATLSAKIPVGAAANTVFGPRYNRFRPISFQGKAREVNVKPIPSSFVGSHWLPAKSVSLKTENMEQEKWAVGVPVVRVIQLQAKGVSVDQLPKINIPSAVGIRQYPDPIQRQQSLENGKLISTVTQKIVLIPTKAGNLQLPAIEVPWWNTESDKMEVAKIAALNLKISADGQQPQNKTTTTPVPSLDTKSNYALTSDFEPETTTSSKAVEADNNLPAAQSGLSPNDEAAFMQQGDKRSELALFIIIAIAILFAALVGWWLGVRTASKHNKNKKDGTEGFIEPFHKSERQLLTAIKRACHENDPVSCRQILVDLVEKRWLAPDTGLGILIDNSTPKLKDEIMELNRFCYTPTESENWNGEQFWQVLDEFMQSLYAAEDNEPTDKLQPLNPF